MRWSPDGARLTVSFNFGLMAQFSADGRKLWEAATGEYALYLSVDANYNVYAAGKSRLLFSWSGTGELRWRDRTVSTLNNGLGGVSRDGSFMTAHSMTEELSAYDGLGHVLWQRGFLTPEGFGSGGIGHQGLAITPDGNWTVVGTWEGAIHLLDKTGTIRWSYYSKDPAVTRPETSFCYTRPGCTGTQSVAISDDGKYIAAGFENSVIRIFRRDP